MGGAPRGHPGIDVEISEHQSNIAFMEEKSNTEMFSSARCGGVPAVALDYSTGGLSVALEHVGGVEVVHVDDLPPRRFAETIAILEELLESKGLAVSDVRRWTCGTGPGSFTALRAMSALVAGIAFGRGAASLARGVPSVAAVGAKVSELCPAAKSCAVLFDARGGRVARYALVARGGVLALSDDVEAAMSPADPAELARYDVVSGFAKDRGVFDGTLPGFDGILYLDHFPVERLLSLEGYGWGEGLESPLYCRPPTDVRPLRINS